MNILVGLCSLGNIGGNNDCLKGKRWHHHQNGAGGTRLHFHGDDASAASMFIMKFFDHITANNLREQMERHARETV